METATEINEMLADLREPLARMSADLRKASHTLRKKDVRWIVDMYYMIQRARVRAALQYEKMSEGAEPHALIEWVFKTMKRFENTFRPALGEFARTYRVGQWLQAQVGIGPVLSAGLLSHFDITRSKTSSGFWSFAGLDPTVTWEPKMRRPWNAKLKALVTFKLGECFVKFCNREDCYYGQRYREKKDVLELSNARGEFAEAAKKKLEKVKIDKSTVAYQHYIEGRLPPAHVHSRARRWAVKLFISHLHHVMHLDYYGVPPVKPYVFDNPELSKKHTHILEPHLWPGNYDGKSLTEMQ